MADLNFFTLKYKQAERERKVSAGGSLVGGWLGVNVGGPSRCSSRHPWRPWEDLGVSRKLGG